MNKKIKSLIAGFFFLFSAINAFSEVYKERAVVSYYAEAFHGKKTSNGEVFDMNKLTCASKTLPFNTELKITNLANNKTVVVRVNDRGPFVVGRELDLSKAAAIQLGMIKSGTATVKIEIIKLGPNTKRSQQTAASAAKIMAKKGEYIKYYTGTTSVKNKTYKNDEFYDIQLGAFSSKENAKQFAAKVSKSGVKNIVLRTNSSGTVKVVIKRVKGSEVINTINKLEEKGFKDFSITIAKS